MRANIVAIILVVLCLGLGGALYYRQASAVKEKKEDVATIEKLSNEVEQVTTKLEEQKLVNLSLERDLENQSEELKSFSNNLATATASLTKAQSDAKAAADAAKAEMLKRDAKIAELESERDDLTKKMAGLNSSINTLETSIAETQKKLDLSEGDREFLLAELKRLQTEKAELERQFNDMALLREQVRRLRDELSISRRLEWIRRGLLGATGLKGAERLQRGFVAAPQTTNYNLNVEINREGGVRVTPPDTNAPPPSASGPGPN